MSVQKIITTIFDDNDLMPDALSSMPTKPVPDVNTAIGAIKADPELPLTIETSSPVKQSHFL